MDTIFMKSKNTKTSDPGRLLLNLTDKIDLRKKYKYIALSNLSIYMEKQKIHKRAMNLKYQRWRRMKSLNYLMNHILYQLFKIILNTY